MRFPILLSLLPVLAAPSFALPSLNELVGQARTAFLASDAAGVESARQQACPADEADNTPISRASVCEILLALADEARGNLPGAEQHNLRAVSVANEGGADYAPLYCAHLVDLGEYYRRRRQPADAEVTLQHAVGVARGLQAQRPDLLPETLNRLGELYAETGHPERALPALREALAIFQAVGGEHLSAATSARVAWDHNLLGMIELTLGHTKESESLLRAAVSEATSALGEDHPVAAVYRANLAMALIRQGLFSRAEPLLNRAQFILESRVGPSTYELGMIDAELCTIATSEGKLTMAEDLARRALAILHQQRRPDPGAIATVEVTLASVYMREHNYDAAESLLSNAVATQRRADTRPATLAASLQLLAQLRAQQRNWQAAQALYREALTFSEDAPTLRALADVLKHTGGSKDEVRALEGRARSLLQPPSSQANPRA